MDLPRWIAENFEDGLPDDVLEGYDELDVDDEDEDG
jgi:hypothetical protein